MRFADDYSGTLVVGIDDYTAITETSNAIELYKLKINCVGSAFAVASGSNEMMNLLDMFVVVTMTRAVVEEYPVPEARREAFNRIRDACRQGEANITHIAESALTPAQLEELRTAIIEYRKLRPELRSALVTRALSIATVAGRRQQQDSGGSVFGLLKLDPLSGLDPAARELAQTRLFGERVLYLAQRIPVLLRWQTELLTLEAAETPAALEIRASTTQIADALDRTSKAIDRLPMTLRTEREHLLEALPGQEPAVTRITAELTTTLEAGRKMSDSLNTTLSTFNTLQQRLSARSANEPPKPAPTTGPSDVEQYAEVARQVSTSAEQLTEMLKTLDKTLSSADLTRLASQVSPVMEQAQTGGRDLVDHSFRMAMLLVTFTCVLIFATVLAVRQTRARR